MKSITNFQKNYVMILIIVLVYLVSNCNVVISQSLTITHPTSGKVFISGTPIEISWIGSANEELVKIEYSINGGQSWTLITESAKNGVYLWDNQPSINTYCQLRLSTYPKPNGKYKEEFVLRGHVNDVYDLDWSPDGLKLVTACWDGSVKLWDCKNGTLITTFVGHSGRVYFAQFSPDGKKIASSSSDRTVVIWDVESGQLETILYGHTGLVWCSQWSSDGKKILSTSQTGECIIWDASTGSIIHKLTQHTGSVHRANWSPDNTKIVSGSSDGTIKIWDVSSGSSLMTLNNFAGLINVTWSPDGTKIASSGNYGSAKVWDATNGNLLNEFFGHNGDVYDIQWNKAGNKLLSTAQDGRARILNPSTNSVEFNLIGHSLNVWNGKWNHDDSKIVTISHDNTIIVWNAQNGTMISRLYNHTRDLNIAKWSPDLIRFASSADDMTARIWTVDSSFASVVSQPFVLEAAPPPPDTGYVVLYPDSRSAYPSTFVEIPIILSSALNVGPAGINTFDLDLNYNNTLLAPVGIKPTVVSGNISSVRLFDLPAIQGEIGKVKFRVGLGDADHCRLFLTNVVAHSGVAQYTILDGKFTLLGVCREGGDRLISTNKDTLAIVSLQISPSNLLESSISTIENGMYEVQIINTLGQILYKEDFLVMNSSDKFISIPIFDYSNGQYLFVVKTPSHQISKSFGIIR